MTTPIYNQQFTLDIYPIEGSASEQPGSSSTLSHNVAIASGVHCFLQDVRKQPEPTINAERVQFRKVISANSSTQKDRMILKDNTLTFNSNHCFYEMNLNDFSEKWDNVEAYLTYHKNLEFRVYTDNNRAEKKLHEHVSKADNQELKEFVFGAENTKFIHYTARSETLFPTKDETDPAILTKGLSTPTNGSLAHNIFATENTSNRFQKNGHKDFFEHLSSVSSILSYKRTI